jgi:hypothetical protein
VIEDVKWADSATLDFLTFLTRAGRADAVTVVAEQAAGLTELLAAAAGGRKKGSDLVLQDGHRLSWRPRSSWPS